MAESLRAQLDAAIDIAARQWTEGNFGEMTGGEYVAETIWPLVEAALSAARRETAEQIATKIEADPGSHWQRVDQFCATFVDDDGNEEPSGCRMSPCPGHFDGHSVIHGREFYAAVARGVGETP